VKKAVLFLAVLMGCLTFMAPAASASSANLGQTVLDAVRSAGFKDMLDGDPAANATAPWYPQIANEPQLDITILDLNAANGVRAAANVLLSRDHPNGVLVPVGSNLSSKEIRYKRWSQARWDGTGGVSWSDPYAPGTDVVPGREGASYEFMLPYPASVLKVMVAHGIMRQVDAGTISLDDSFSYPGGGGGLCGGASTRTVNQWMQNMITVSDNKSTCAMILRLHQLNEIGALNQHFIDIGLPSLQLNGTSSVNGAGWSPGQISMGSLDTAKLMWLTDGGPGVLWRTAGGDPVTNTVLSATSRAFLKDIYARQGFNEVLSTTNWCGKTLGSNFTDPTGLYPAAGIPSPAPAEFILPDGTVEAGGIPYGQPVGPCNDAAEVLFSHKTGLTYNFGADAGYAHELDGQRNRDYVISVITNLGNRYADPIMNTALTDPAGPFGCWTDSDICYSEAFAKFGKSIDDALKARPQIAYGDGVAKVGESFELAPSQAAVGADPSWSISPSPPAGLSFNRATGVISGTPTQAGPAVSYTVQAEDETGPGDTSFSLTVDAADPPPPQIAYGNATAQVGVSFELAPSQAEVAAGAAWSVSPALPDGLSLNTATGVITGTPTVAATATTYTVLVEDATGSGQAAFALTVNAADPPPVGSPRLAIQVAPATVRIRTGRTATFRATVRNRGDATASSTLVCARVPNPLRVRGDSCVRTGDLAAGTARQIRFRINTQRVRPRSYQVRFIASAGNSQSAQRNARLIVRR